MFDAEDYSGLAADYGDFTDGFGNDFTEDPAPCTCDGPHCQNCGCCDENPCPGGCVWATPTLCSRCV
jgi:hypothetical protein